MSKLNLNLAETSHKSIKLTDIDMGERARIEYEHIDELITDIKSVGLINDICVMFRPAKPYLLLAGGRRLTAIKQMAWPTVSCKIYPTLTQLEILIVELSENLNRDDLSPIVILQQRAKIFKLIQRNNLDTGKKPATIDQIAKVIGCDKSTLSRDLKMAAAMEQHPEIAVKATSRKDIANSINKMQAASIMEEISDRHDKDDLEEGLDAINKKTPIKSKTTTNSDEPKDEAKIKSDSVKMLLKNFIVGDTFETCQKLIDNKATVNLVELDPPYAIDYTKVKQSKENTESYEEIPEEEYYIFMKKCLEDAWALLPPDGWAVCWYAISKYHDMILRLARGVGFTNLGIPAIWTKPNSTGQNNQPTINLSSTYETFFILRKGKAFLNKNARANEFRYPNVKGKSHATEKPVELYQDIFSTLVPRGSHILSMFAGSGSPIIAGFLEGMQILGIDSAKKHKVSYEGLLRKYMKV